MQPQNSLPEQFLARLKKIIPQELFSSCLEGFSSDTAASFRVNTLKTTVDEVKEIFKAAGISFKTVSVIPEAVILSHVPAGETPLTELLTRGAAYRQSLSSMLAVSLLSPQPGERILDMCAAPGSKASQIASRMKNTGELVCLEAVRSRYYKLKSVLNILGVTCAHPICIDARRYRDNEGFDRVLVDAPCSSEGRFKTGDKKSFAYWSLRKIKEMSRKQKGLLLSAGRLVKRKGVLVYATCTFAPEENETVVDWFLRKTEKAFTLEPVSLPGIRTYPALSCWGGKIFDPQVKHCVRVLPTDETQAFFIAKFVKR